MEEKISGKIIKGTGGLYVVETRENPDGKGCGGYRLIYCKARGIFRFENITPLAGDNVELMLQGTDSDGAVSAVIDKILPRKNSLIRPPVANLDYLFIVTAARSPDPQPLMTDKLISIAEFNKIEPVLIVNKRDLDSQTAEQFAEIYRRAGFSVFDLCSRDANSIKPLSEFISAVLKGKCAAFTGVSGAGKSTLMNSLFPGLDLPTSVISEKIRRGKHTTRHVELYRVNETPDGECGYLADTPGFSMLDFEHFDFFTGEDLPHTFREFEKHIGSCRYRKCTHTKEDGCSIVEAVRSGEISKSRHESFVNLYDILKNKKSWKK